MDMGLDIVCVKEIQITIICFEPKLHMGTEMDKYVGRCGCIDGNTIFCRYVCKGQDVGDGLWVVEQC